MVDLFCSPPHQLTDSTSHWPNPFNYGVGSLLRGGTWNKDVLLAGTHELERAGYRGVAGCTERRLNVLALIT